MEADISIWRKTGHFYFALTRICHESRPQRDQRDSDCSFLPVWRAPLAAAESIS